VPIRRVFGGEGGHVPGIGVLLMLEKDRQITLDEGA